MKMVWKL